MTTTADIEVALGRTPSDAEAAQWEMWITDALMLIEARLGDGFAVVDATKLDYVVREAVLAHIRRPDDATTVDVSVDDGRVSRTYRSSGGRVTIRDEWWDLLSPSDSSNGAFSITPGGTSTMHLPWCASMLGANYCSCGADIAGYPIYEGADW